MLTKFWKDESGATAIEYTLIAALIGVALIGALGTLRGNIESMMTTAGSSISGAGGGGGT